MPTDPPNATRPLAAAAAWVRRWLTLLLMASYVTAACFAAPGEWLSDLGGTGPFAAVRFSLLMVGVLLFCGAVSLDLRSLRELPRSPLGVTIALLGSWALPVAVVAVWGHLAPSWLPRDEAASISLGLALAAAMPVANSAVAWTHQTGGSLAWALGLVMASTLVCPWVSPAILRLMGLAASGSGAGAAEQLVNRVSGAVFRMWVLGPTLAGIATRASLGASRVSALGPWLTLASAGALLLLNYANAATALPQVFENPSVLLLATALAAAASLPLMGAACAWPLAVVAGVPPTGRIAWVYALAMKNTGLALGIAGVTLGDRPVATLVILAATLMQHCIAGGVHALAARRGRHDASAH